MKMVDRSRARAPLRSSSSSNPEGTRAGRGSPWPAIQGEAESLRAMCRAFGAVGRLVVTCLEAGGRTVASNVMVTAGDEVFGCLVAYDEEYTAYSPGIQLHYDSIDLLGQAGFRRFDTCTYAGNTAIADVFPGRIEVTTLLVGLGSPVERSLLAALPTARRWRGALRPRAALRS